MAANPNIRQRKNMAMGNGPMAGNDLSMPQVGSKVIPHPDRGMDTSKLMQDTGRAATPPVPAGATRMANPGTVDHGPHNHRAVKPRDMGVE